MQDKGICNVDLRRSDLEKTTFDHFTVWPEREYLPPGFDPDRVMEIGKDPGLGIRELGSAGIDGTGVKVAIIDQPLLRNHEEYIDNIQSYNEVETEPAGPQMHGTPSLVCFVVKLVAWPLE
jgi:hypothetical protein